MKEKILTVYAPASSGNVSVGFDSLGLALAPVDGSLLGDCVSIIEGKPAAWIAVTSRRRCINVTAKIAAKSAIMAAVLSKMSAKRGT